MCGISFDSLLLAELWLKLERCQLVRLPAKSIKQEATGSKGEWNVIIPETKQDLEKALLFCCDCACIIHGVECKQCIADVRC